MSARPFDLAGFLAALDGVRKVRGATMKQVAKDTGVSPSTLSRMRTSGRRPDAASLAALSAWAGINAAQFVALEPPPPQLNADALMSSLREMVNAEVQRSHAETDAMREMWGLRYSLHETALRQQIHILCDTAWAGAREHVRYA